MLQKYQFRAILLKYASSQSEMVLESRPPPDNFIKEEWPVFPKESNQMILFSLYHFRRPNERQIELGYLPNHYPEKKIVKNEPQTAKAHFLWIMTYEQTAKQ